MNDQYFEIVKAKYAPFIKEILRHDTTEYLELGCGAGTITKAIREVNQLNSSHILIDACPKMLSLAIENNVDYQCDFVCADITDSAYYERRNGLRFDFNRVVHSHGVLEHFNDDQILRILDHADNIAGIQVHYVPGAKWAIPSRGDERLLTIDHWREILQKAQVVLGRGIVTEIKPFNDDYDFIITIKRKFM